MNKNKNQSRHLDPMLIGCFITFGATVVVLSLFIPPQAEPSGDVRIYLPAQTNRFGDNWTALTYNGVAVGGWVGGPTNKQPRYEILELNGAFTYRDNKYGWIGNSMKSCEDVRTLIGMLSKSEDKTESRLKEESDREKLPWKVVECDGNENSGSITGTNLIVPKFDHVGTNYWDHVPIWNPTNSILKPFTIDDIRLTTNGVGTNSLDYIPIWNPTNVFYEHYMIGSGSSPKETNIFVLSVDSTNLIAVHPDGTVTLSNTNLDLVSSNFWKVLGVYFSDHYVLKEQ